jgi:NAD(P)-dependent dehydrogenase (short-subunit alcohol dehydrogenase family)
MEPIEGAQASADPLRGRVYLITGANTGIGRATALALARRGARVLMGCRSRERGQPALEQIRAETGNDGVELVEMDLGSFASIRRAAAALLARDLPLHVLINNAGLAARGRTADGFELVFGVNHLGHFLLTNLLLERLRASAPARVVTVASRGHYKARGIDFEAVRRPTLTRVALHEYEVSKLANVLFSAELARRTAGTGITTYALHPGVIASDIWRRLPWPIRPIALGFMDTNETGAAHVLDCAVNPARASETGRYYSEGRERTPSRLAQDLALARELWERSAAWCGLTS